MKNVLAYIYLYLIFNFRNIVGNIVFIVALIMRH